MNSSNGGPKKGSGSGSGSDNLGDDTSNDALAPEAIPSSLGAKPKHRRPPAAHRAPQMRLPATPPPPVGASFSQSTTLDNGIANDMKYRLVLKDDFSEDPPYGVIFVNKNVQNHELIFKVKGVKGDVFEEPIAIGALPANDTLDVQKLITHKAAILGQLQARENRVKANIQALKTEEKNAAEARKLAIVSELEAENNRRLFRSKAELKQATLDKDLKKRLEVSKTMEGVMTPSLGDIAHSNATQLQHLAGYSMEALAIKMNLELLFFCFKIVWAPTVGYAMALKQYEQYAQQYPGSKYDGQKLYAYTTDSKGNFKLDRTNLVAEKDITLDIILANGYLPKPGVFDQLRETLQDYVIQQMGVDIYENITIAKKHFHCQSAQPSQQQDQDNDLEGAVLSRPKPLPPRGPVQ